MGHEGHGSRKMTHFHLGGSLKRFCRFGMYKTFDEIKDGLKMDEKL